MDSLPCSFYFIEATRTIFYADPSLVCISPVGGTINDQETKDTHCGKYQCVYTSDGSLCRQ